MRIELVEYRPKWKRMFAEERELLRVALADTGATIEHIGSTAVEGLIAKPIIDILIGLTDFLRADSLVPRFQSLGYEYISRYETEMPYRRFFMKSRDAVRTHNVHMVQIDSEFWQRHLLFRDYLRQNPDALRRYAELKSQLAERDWQDTNQYADAKSDFIRAMEAEARAVSITTT